MNRKDIKIYTGASCINNPGPGGYAAILRFGDYEKEISGSECDRTTNSRMELKAIIEAVRAVKVPCNITFCTGSQYVCNGIARAKEHCANGWRSKSGATLANVDMWKELANLGKSGRHHYAFQQIDDKDEMSKRCAKLAKQKAKEVPVNV